MAMETHSRARVMRWYTALWDGQYLDSHPRRSRPGKSCCLWTSGLRQRYSTAVPGEGLSLQWKDRGVKKSTLARICALFSTSLVLGSFAFPQTNTAQPSSQP